MNFDAGQNFITKVTRNMISIGFVSIQCKNGYQLPLTKHAISATTN